MRKLKSVLIMSGAILAAFSLTTCATNNSNAVRNGDALSPSARLYGDYLAATYAHHLGDAKARSLYYSRAQKQKPADLDLGRTAMASALNAGDFKLATDLAKQIFQYSPHEPLAKTILAVQKMTERDYTGAVKTLSDQEDGTKIGSTSIGPTSIGMSGLQSLIKGWAYAGAGDYALAETTFENLAGGRYFELMGQLQNANLFAKTGEIAKAELAYLAVDTVGISSIESALSQARFYASQGQNDKALKRLSVFTKKNGDVATGPIKVYIDKLESGKNLNAELNVSQLASRALTEPAFGFYGVKRQYEAVEMFLRLALELDPQNDKARLFLGSVLEDIDRGDDALAQYAQIKMTASYSVSARLSEANVWFVRDDNERALKILKAVHKQNPSKQSQDALGRAYLITEEYGKALPFYEALIDGMSKEQLRKNPQAKYLRGICLERLDRWQEAVVDFEFVLKHEPKNADALNYLGYTWVDKGVNLGQAFTMIRKAVALEPQSGAIIDSLGWAHFKLGQYGQAKQALEKAVQHSPSSATIVDHLGDVYWKLGRTKEAGYQWDRALTLDPTTKEAKLLRSKLKDGYLASDLPQ